jgi:hypothetical protein
MKTGTREATASSALAATLGSYDFPEPTMPAKVRQAVIKAHGELMEARGQSHLRSLSRFAGQVGGEQARLTRETAKRLRGIGLAPLLSLGSSGRLLPRGCNSKSLAAGFNGRYPFRAPRAGKSRIRTAEVGTRF